MALSTAGLLCCDHSGCSQTILLGAQPGAALGQGVDVFGDRFRTVDDQLVLIGSGDVVGQWQLPALGAEGDPVECAADRKGTAGFEVGLLAHRVQCGGQRAEIVDGRFAASDHGKLGAGVGDFGREGCGLEPVNVLRIIKGQAYKIILRDRLIKLFVRRL